MIFVTVGMQMPFDRLVLGVDRWAKLRGLGREVFAQIGPGGAVPEHIHCRRFLNSSEYEKRVTEATLLVGHAGIGTIIKALERGVPIIVMPRLKSFGETRSDHQLATCKRIERLYKVAAAETEEELFRLLDAASEQNSGIMLNKNLESRLQLISFIRDFCLGRNF